MSEKDTKDLLQFTIKKDGEYQRQLVEVIEQKIEEIERLKESEEYHRKGFAELYKRIEDAIEYIKENMKDSQLVFGINDINRLYIKYMNDLLDILEGKGNENV